LRERAVAPVEPLGRTLEHAVGVGIVSNAVGDLGRPARGRYRRL
jgi:hypothetical protein